MQPKRIKKSGTLFVCLTPNLIKRENMFRIKKVFENLSLVIYKIEGKVTDDSMTIWMNELNALNLQPERQVILDFCQVWSINAVALEFLVTYLSSKVFEVHIINPGMEVRNMLHTAGLSARVLE